MKKILKSCIHLIFVNGNELVINSKHFTNTSLIVLIQIIIAIVHFFHTVLLQVLDQIVYVLFAQLIRNYCTKTVAIQVDRSSYTYSNKISIWYK